MRSVFVYLFVSLVFIFPLTGKCQNQEYGSISGKLYLDSIWEPSLYLSYIEDFNSMYVMSNRIIVQKANLDDQGRFHMSLDFLPVEDHLYRIHFVKKGDPAASIIIGGQEENHFFTFANRFSTIQLSANPENNLVSQLLISGSPINNQFAEVRAINNYTDSLGVNTSQIKAEFMQKAVNEKFRFIADTTQHALLSLYAIYASKFESNYHLNPNFYDNYAEKWSEEEGSYFKAFREQLELPVKPKEKSAVFWLIICAAIIVSFFLGRLSKRSLGEARHIEKLSVQERKVFHLIQQGLSNQDISNECNIGISTVKSHVSNIYAKLNIKSRKEAMNIKV